MRNGEGGVRRRGGRRAGRAGFTLLEVIIALTILGVGIVAVMQLFPASLRKQSLASERSVVASLARSQLSEVRTLGPGQTVSQWLQQNAYRIVASAAQSYTLYDSWRANVSRIGQGDAALYRVLFTVHMHDGRDEEFVTYVTER